MSSAAPWGGTQAMPLLSHEQWLDRAAVIAKDHTWTWREIHAASLALSDRLIDSQVICNLCTSHLACLIVWLASARRGLQQILPASRGHLDLIAMLSTSLKPTLLVSDDCLGHATHLAHVNNLFFQPEVSRNLYSDEQLSWSPEPNVPLFTLYTSGSTGAPEAHHKSLGQLVEGARVLGARIKRELSLGLTQSESVEQKLPERLAWLVSSVPLQHMFGIETALMLSVVYGNPVLNLRPLLPADIQRALALCPEHSVWITTPLHLSALARSETAIKNCSLVLASTMPLSTELAAKTEHFATAPLIEIYGSTETGALATRRTAITEEWLLLDGVDLLGEPNRLSVVGKHFISPQILTDSIAQTSSTTFKLLGRAKDMIKIAGRRTSVSTLNLIVQNLAGLDDAAFYLSNATEFGKRLALIYVSHTLRQGDIKAYLRKKIDPIFIPRVFIKVECIGRSETGKLTDQILASIHTEWLAHKRQAARSVTFSVSSKHPCLAGHFPNYPVVPGVVILEKILAGLIDCAGCCSSTLRQIKFDSMLRPGELAKISYQIQADKCVFEVSANRENSKIVIARGTLTIDLTQACHEVD